VVPDHTSQIVSAPATVQVPAELGALQVSHALTHGVSQQTKPEQWPLTHWLLLVHDQPFGLPVSA
jgi:hypothetical protein